MEATQSESRSSSAACTVLRRDSCTGRGTDGLGKDLHNARVRLRESHNPLLPCRNSTSEGCQCGSLHPRAETNQIAEQGVVHGGEGEFPQRCRGYCICVTWTIRS